MLAVYNRKVLTMQNKLFEDRFLKFVFATKTKFDEPIHGQQWKSVIQY